MLATSAHRPIDTSLWAAERAPAGSSAPFDAVLGAGVHGAGLMQAPGRWNRSRTTPYPSHEQRNAWRSVAHLHRAHPWTSACGPSSHAFRSALVRVHAVPAGPELGSRARRPRAHAWSCCPQLPDQTRRPAAHGRAPEFHDRYHPRPTRTLPAKGSARAPLVAMGCRRRSPTSPRRAPQSALSHAPGARPGTGERHRSVVLICSRLSCLPA